MGFLKTDDIHCPISGSVGALVFRRSKKGRVIVAHKPTSFTVPMTPLSVLIRQKFGFIANLYKALRNLPNFVTIWKDANVKGNSVYIKFLALNIPRAGADFNPMGLSLSPTMKGFDLSGSEFAITANEVTLNLDPLGVNTGIVPATETKIISSGVMVLSSPIDSNDQNYIVVPLISASVPTELVNPISFVLPMASEDAVMVPRYQDKRVLVNLTSLTAANVPVRTSETISN